MYFTDPEGIEWQLIEHTRARVYLRSQVERVGRVAYHACAYRPNIGSNVRTHQGNKYTFFPTAARVQYLFLARADIGFQ